MTWTASQGLTSEIQLLAGTHLASCLAPLAHLTAGRLLPVQADFNHLNLLSSRCPLAYSTFVAYIFLQHVAYQQTLCKKERTKVQKLPWDGTAS